MKKQLIPNKKLLMRYCTMLFSVLFLTLFMTKAVCQVHQTPASPIEGRWDITIDMEGKNAPSWLEVTHSGLHTLVGQFVGTGGSARPISKVNFDNGKLSFAIPPQWETENKDLEVEGTLNGERLEGTMIFSNGKTHNWTGVRAPVLRRKSAPVWGKPVILFDGKNLAE